MLDLLQVIALKVVDVIISGVATATLRLCIVTAPLVAFVPTVAPGIHCVTSVPSPSGTYGVPIASLPVTTYAADTLDAEFLNAAGSVVVSSAWGAPATQYFQATDFRYLSMQSLYCSRDMEVETWSRNGIMFVRKTEAGTALYLQHNGEVSPNGFVEIGIVTNFVEGVAFKGASGTFYRIYTGDFAAVPGYDRANTLGAVITFGVQGFDVYAKFNGVEFVRFQEYRHMAPGRAAFQGNTGYGFREVTLRHYAARPLYSAYATNTLDLRDFGWRDLRTSGTIAQGSNLLTVANSTAWRVGDYVVVETEQGRGTKGVGGTWPALSYPTLTQMQADTSQANNLYAWVEATGNVYRWTGGVWEPQTSYYTAKAIPLALGAQILAITGNVLTLNVAAATAASQAVVHFDNAYVFNKLGRDPRYDGESNFPLASEGGFDFSAITPANLRLQLPTGHFAIGYMLLLHNHTGWTIEGAGKDCTTLYSPKGTPSGMLHIYRSPQSTVRQLHLRGNTRDQGFGLQWSLNSPLVTQSDIPQGGAYPSGLLFQESHDGSASDVNVTNVFQSAVGTRFSNNVVAQRITYSMTDGLRIYVQWGYQWADAIGGGCIDCTMTSPTLIAGFEAFKSSGVQFLRPRGTNAVISMNDAGNWLVQDGTITVTALSQHPTDGAFSHQNPLFNVNTNIGAVYAPLGGTITNLTLLQEGYINAANDTLKGIVVNANNPNIVVTGGVYQAPNWAAPSTLNGPNGLNSVGAGLVVNGFQVIGTVNTAIHPLGNIRATQGAISNCIADVISIGVGVTVTNCHNNVGGDSTILP